MEIITKDLEALAYDLKVLRASLSECKRDCDRGLHFDEQANHEGQTKEFRLAALFGRLGDAYQDFDRRIDEVGEIEDRLLDLIDKVEYEGVAAAAKVSK